MPRFHPIHLSLHIGNWRLFALRQKDKGFEKFSKKVLERDDYTCCYCGFQASQYQEVINLDQNYHNNRLSNLVTACCFCMQCFFLEAVGQSEYGGGTLIYLPEITQTDLNGLCHVLFCAMANATNYRSDAQAIFNDLRLRARPIESKFGEGMSNPNLLARILIDTPMEQRAHNSNMVLSNLRLLPSRAKFSQQIETWAASALDQMSDL